MKFDKKQFAKWLELAKGKRSINKYGNDSEVDPGYISRYLRGLIDQAPSANIIKKLALNAHNNISVEQLLAAAGYLDLIDLTGMFDYVVPKGTIVDFGTIVRSTDQAKSLYEIIQMYLSDEVSNLDNIKIQYDYLKQHLYISSIPKKEDFNDTPQSSLFLLEFEKLSDEDKQKAIEHIKFLQHLAKQKNERNE